jgi:hypothetical protein
MPKMIQCPFCRNTLPNHDSRCNFIPSTPGSIQRKQHHLLKRTINTNVSQANMPNIDQNTKKQK